MYAGMSAGSATLITDAYKVVAIGLNATADAQAEGWPQKVQEIDAIELEFTTLAGGTPYTATYKLTWDVGGDSLLMPPKALTVEPAQTTAAKGGAVENYVPTARKAPATFDRTLANGTIYCWVKLDAGKTAASVVVRIHWKRM